MGAKGASRKGGKIIRGSLINFMGERAQEVGEKDLLMGPAICWPPIPPWPSPNPM